MKKEFIFMGIIIVFLIIMNILVFQVVQSSQEDDAENKESRISQLELIPMDELNIISNSEDYRDTSDSIRTSSSRRSRRSRRSSDDEDDDDEEPIEDLELYINQEIYLAPYVGDIDGHVSENWFPFYERLMNFFDDNEIPVSFSFYPVTLEDDVEFNTIFGKIYESDYVELIQKGYRADETEMIMDELPFEEQKQIISDGQEHFRSKMQEILNISEAEEELPTAYNQIHGRFTNETRTACIELGFEMFFDMFLEDDLYPVESTDDFYVTQYGVGFSTDGNAGRETEFWDAEEIYKQINEFDREDLTVLTIGDKKVVPLWLHHQDFEDKDVEELVDEEKWDLYTSILLKLKEDSNVTIVSPKEIYKLKQELG